MSYAALDGFFTFIGLNGTKQEKGQGKRRVVTYLAFVCFALLAAAIADQEWVSGASEVPIYSSVAPSRRLGALAASACPDDAADIAPLSHGGRELQFRPIVHEQYFQVGLATAAVWTSAHARFVPEDIQSMCSWKMSDFLDDWNSGVQTPGSYLAKGKVVSYSVIQATEGLMGFALALQLLAWLTMVAIQYDAPTIGNNKYSIVVARVLLGSAMFFAIVALINFGASPAQTEFCSAFDPHPSADKRCGFGNGFNIAVAAAVFLGITTGIACFWMRWDLSDRNSGGAKSGYEAVGGSQESSGATPLAAAAAAVVGFEG